MTLSWHYIWTRHINFLLKPEELLVAFKACAYVGTTTWDTHCHAFELSAALGGFCGCHRGNGPA